MTTERSVEIAPDDTPASAWFEGSVAMNRWGLAGWDVLSMTVAAFTIVAFFPPFFLDSWTPRVALVVAAGPIGVGALVTSAVRHDRASRWLLAALLWTLLAAMFSGSPRSAVVGFAGRDLSGLVVVACAGLWSLARLMNEHGRRFLVDVIVWSAALSATVGVLQVVADVQNGPLALAAGRPIGLASNPVYFGAVSAVGLVAAVARWSASNWRWLLVPTSLCGVAVSLSGSRVALIAAVLSAGVYMATKRDRDTIVAGMVALGSMVVGASVDRIGGSGRNSIDRLATDGGGDGRTSVWRYAIEAWAERPLHGYGFGRFRPAVQGKFTPDFVRANTADGATMPWFDAHNVVIAVLVAVGIVGLALFVGWALIWATRLRGPLAWALLPLVVHWLLQPVSLYTLPLAMLMFGAAGAEKERINPPSRRSVWIVGVPAVVLAFTVVVADLVFQRAADDLDAQTLGAIASAAAQDDPILGDITAQAYTRQQTGSDSSSVVVEWRERVVAVEPDRPLWWEKLATAQLQAGDEAAAQESVGRALELQPTSPGAWRLELELAFRAEDIDRLDVALDRLCELGAGGCDLDAAELVAQRDG